MGKCVWRDETDPNYRCAMEALEGRDLCILHEPGDKDLDEFKRWIYAQIDAQGPTEALNPRYDFRGYVFPVGISVGEDRKVVEVVLPRTTSSGIKFNLARIGGSAVFMMSNIQGGLNFWGAEIEGDMVFQRSQIERGANFRDTKLHGSVNFSAASINTDADFSRAQIEGSVVFMDAKISGNVNFMDAEIHGDVNFMFVQCNGSMFFTQAQIGGSANFKNAKIEDDIDLIGANINGNIDFTEVMIEGNAQLSQATIRGHADFSNARVAGSAHFEGAEIWGRVNVSFADAAGLSLGELLPTTIPRFRWPERRLANRCGITLHNLSTAPEFWRFAQRMFEKNGERDKADAAFYFSRLTRFSPWRVKREGSWKQQLVQVFRRIATLPAWLADCLFLRWSIGYGASLPRTVITWFLIIGGFTVLYATLPGALAEPREALWTVSNWSKAFYSSVAVFLTLGMGAVQETTTLGRTLIAAEGLLGALLMALTVAVVTRKFMR